jgi:hypothetical protein
MSLYLKTDTQYIERYDEEFYYLRLVLADPLLTVEDYKKMQVDEYTKFYECGNDHNVVSINTYKHGDIDDIVNKIIYDSDIIIEKIKKIDDSITSIYSTHTSILQHALKNNN